ncbi:MAG: uridine diphosphate-N-acetylglucosamine-binding protein YvcK [Actinomycetia bacterium]|nr:uridine diphosphate-N-acetylglucosamine-binding protein YvcK [Actinomycetes bacterium]
MMEAFGSEPRALLKELDLSFDGPHVVAIGGGHGLSKVLQSVLSYAGKVDAIVSVADDGGSSGRLAPHLDIPPPGDIRKCLVALTPDESIWKRLFEYRFEGADVAGHSLGNLILAGLADIDGSFEQALIRAERLLGASGSVIPSCRDHLVLRAESEGTVLTGQVNIAAHRGKIDAISVVPETAAATPRAIMAIEDADQIVIGPGSLMTSTIAAMRVPGITEAINRSRAQLVYVANLTTQDGETIGMDGIDHLDALMRLTGVRSPSAIVGNDQVIETTPPLQGVRFDPDITATFGADLVTADVVDTAAEWPSHDPGKLGGVLNAVTRQSFRSDP